MRCPGNLAIYHIFFHAMLVNLGLNCVTGELVIIDLPSVSRLFRIRGARGACAHLETDVTVVNGP